MKNFNVTSMLVMLMFMCITSMQAQSITPSKKYITKELNNVSNFSSIRVLGSPDVEYRQSSDSKTTVSIYGSDNLVDLLEVSTVNGVLQVNIKKGVKILSGERRLKVIASSPSLDDVDIKGSADVYLKGTLKGADLNLNITGSGDIEAESSRSAPLRELSPLRTVRASFPAYGSSNMTITDFVVGRVISFSTFIFIIYFAFYVYNWYVQEFLPFVRRLFVQ